MRKLSVFIFYLATDPHRHILTNTILWPTLAIEKLYALRAVQFVIFYGGLG